MKTTTIRQLKHATTTVLSWVADGQIVEVRRRDEPVALLFPPTRRSVIRRPDFAARLRAIYGRKRLRVPASDLIAESRGDS